MKHVLVCSECGKTFISERYNALTCSSECLRKRQCRIKKEQRDAVRVELQDIPCGYCGKMFKPRNKMSKYCSKECRLEDAKAQKRAETKTRKKGKKPTAICKHCKKRFEVTPEHGLYCSKECRDEYIKERMKEEHKNNKSKGRKQSHVSVAARKAGMTYAEYQIQETLRMIPPIKRSL